jgi:putative transposase
MPRANRYCLLPSSAASSNRSKRSTAALRSKRYRSMPFRRLQKFHWVPNKSFGLSVLNYMVTSNHIHLLVKDTGPKVIAQGMQLIAGRTAQEYNQQKRRQGSVMGRPLSRCGNSAK